jgi:dihydroneopterin aldolase
MSDRRDRIRIDSLELSAQIGITEEERAHPQRLTLSLTFETAHGFVDLRDDIQRTVDYASVCAAARMTVQERPRQLLETLGEELAHALLAQFPIRALRVELRKYVVPDTAFVAVELERKKSSL